MKGTDKVTDMTSGQPIQLVKNDKSRELRNDGFILQPTGDDDKDQLGAKSQVNGESGSSSVLKNDVNKKKIEGDLETKQIPFQQMYRYAEYFDYFLLILGLGLGVTQGVLASIQAIIFKRLTDTLVIGQATWETSMFNMTAFHNGAMDAIYMYASYGAGVFALATVSMSCWHTLGERQIHQIRKHYLAAVLRQNMGWFDKHESGELTMRMFDGIDRVKDGIGDKMGILFIYGTSFISGLVVAFTCSWQITLVMLAFVLLPAGLTGFLAWFISINSRKESRAYEKAAAIAEEVITGIRTVIALNGQQKEIDRYQKKLHEASMFGVRKSLFIAFATGWLMGTIFIAMAVAFWFGTKLYNDGLIEPGTVFATFWAFMGGTFSLGMAIPQLVAVMGARNAASSIFEVIDRTPEIDCQSSEGSSIMNPKGEIEFKNIHFRYPTRPEKEILKGISFKIKAEQSVALVGASGCGKTTLIGLLLRYYNQESGEVMIDGIPINTLNIRWLRRIVGVVSQEPILFAATVEQNLRFGNEDMTAEDMERVCRIANAHNFIKELPQGYKTRIGEGGVQLSGGQKQRVAIARALARDPKILLLDEATSSLDTESEKIVQHALEKASAGRTTLTIAHRLSTVRNADRIIVLDHGQIAETGTHEELMARGGIYTQLVLAQDIEKASKEDIAVLEEETEMIKEESSGMVNLTYDISSTHIAPPFHSMSSVERMSHRISRSISNTSSAQRNIEDLKQEAKGVKAKEVNIIDILRFAHHEWSLLFSALTFALLKGFIFPIFSIIYGSIFRTLAKPSAEQRLQGAAMNAIYFTMLGVGAGFVTFFAGFLFGAAGESLTKRLRVAAFANIIKQDGEYFDSLDHASGILITRLATDAPNIRAAIDQRLADVVQAIVCILVAIGIAFYYGPKMAPVGILTAMTLMLFQTIIAQYLKKRSAKDEILTREPFRLATEAIEQHKTVQYLTREQHFYNEFNYQMRKPHYKALQRGIVQASAFALHACFIYFNFAAAYRYGLWLVETGNADPYQIFQVIETLNVASMSMIAFGTYVPEYVRARLSANLIFKILAEKPKINSLSEGGKKKILEGNIKFDDVRFAYPVNRKQLVLRGLNIEVLKGKTVALVGPSGCGKSTIIQLVERFYDPLDGKVMYDNADTRELNLRNLRNQVALVSQEPILFNYSVRENIAYGLADVSQEEIEEAAKLANAHNFIMEMENGYDTNVGEKGGQLSGGQKQRIAIARAIVRNPTVLLLDEATSSLDSESEKVVEEALDRARNGRTCIVIAHRLSSIQNSDLIVVIKDGAVVEYGTHQELLYRKGLYARFTEMQNLQ